MEGKLEMKRILNFLWEHMWVGLFLIIAPCLIMARVPDTDTYFLAATGKYIVETGTVPTINPFVIHDGFGIIVQQWLFDVIIYGIFNSFGNMGLFVFVASAFTVSMILLYKYFGLFTENKTVKAIVLLISGFLYISFGVARPTSISFIIMLSLLYCLEQYRRTGKKIYLIALPFLSLIEINVHSAMWPMMFVLIVPYIFPYTIPYKDNIKANIKKWFSKNKGILLTGIIMFSVGFINPNGEKGIAYIFKSYGSANGGLQIKELMAPTTNSLYGLVILLAVAFLALYIYQNKDKLKDKTYDMQSEFTKFYMACGVLFLSCLHLRNMWYLILGATPIIISVINDWKTQTQQNKPKEPKKQSTYKLLIKNFICIGLITLLSFFMFTASSFSSYAAHDSQYAPIKAVEYLDKNTDKDIILYTEFYNGAFMEWHEYQVYIDARPEIFQKEINGKEDVYAEYCKVVKGNIDYKEFLEKYKFTHLIVTKNTLFDMYLSLNQEYTAAVTGNGYKLYVHNK